MSRGRTAGGWLVLLAALWVVHLLGVGPLATPPADVEGLRAWLQARSSVEAAFALLRLVGLGLGWYLLVVGLLARLARARRRARLTALVEVLTLPLLRPVLAGLFGVGLSATHGLRADPPGRHAVVLAQAHSPDHADPAEDEHTAVMRVLEPAATPAEPTWTVTPGDHLWSIAEATLASAWERPPAEAEVARYWRRLVADNQHRLVVAENPDLVFAGQRFRLPAVPPG
jgi:hypothetical protein